MKQPFPSRAHFPCHRLFRVVKATCLIGIFAPFTSLTAQTSPAAGDSVVVDSADSPPVRGDAGIDDVEVNVTESGEIIVTDGPAILGRGPDWEVNNAGLLKREGGVAVHLEEGGILRNRGEIVGDVRLGTGDATLLITPDSTIDGTVDAEGGTNTLELSTGSTFGEYDGSFTNFTQLHVDSSTVFSNTLWRLINAQNFATTEISSGFLETTDPFTSDITVQEGGTFISAGSVVGGLEVFGDLWVGTIDSQGFLVAPDGGGILTVDGNVTFQNGSSFEVMGGETSLDATGDIVIGDGTQATAPNLVVNNSGLSWDEDHLILSGDSLDGEFGEATADSDFILINVEYDATSASVSKDVHRENIAAAGETSNQRSVARALSNLAPNEELLEGYREFADQGNSQNFGQIADTMSGEIIASGTVAHASYSKNFRQSILNTIQHRPDPDEGFAPHPNAPPEPKGDLDRALWTRGFGAWGDLERSGSDDRVDYQTAGLLVGADTVWTEESRAGIAFGYGNSQVSHERDEIDGNFYQAALYASRQRNGFIFNGTLGYGFHDMESERVVQPANEKVGASYNGHELFGSIQATMIVEEEGVLILPLAGLEASHFEQGSFKENGAWGISGSSTSISSIKAFAGVRMMFAHITSNDGVVVPELRFRYSHELLDREASFSGSFRNDAAGNSFTTTGASMSPGDFQIGLGVMVQPGGWDRLSIFADYDVSTQRQQLFSAGVRYQF